MQLLGQVGACCVAVGALCDCAGAAPDTAQSADSQVADTESRRGEVLGAERTSEHQPSSDSSDRAPSSGGATGIPAYEEQRHLLDGDRALEQGDWDEAAAAFAWLKKRNLAMPEARLGLLRAEAGKREFPLGFADGVGDSRIESLVRRLESLATGSPDFAAAHVELGRWLLVLGEPIRAERTLHEAARLGLSSAETWSLRGVASLARGEVGAAVGQFRRAARLEPNDPAHYTNWGSALLVAGNADAAVQSFRRVLELAGESARARSDLGTALLASGRIELALSELARAVALEPERATYRSNWAYGLLRAGRHDASLEQSGQALELDPRLGAAWINRGLAQAGKREYVLAREAFEQALRLDPSDPRAQQNLADLDELER